MSLPKKPFERYRLQAKHNESLLNESCFPDPCKKKVLPYLDWNITLSFYIALHFIQSYLSKSGYKTKFKSHLKRNDYLEKTVSVRDTKIKKILADYLALYKLSKNYRYTPCQFHYQNSTLACEYELFASKELPTILGLI